MRKLIENVKLRKASGRPASVLCFALVILLFSSCRTFIPNRMFASDSNNREQTDTTATAKKEYLIAIGDRLDMHFYSVEGFKLVDVTNTAQGTSSEGGVSYIVEDDGLVKLPIIGKVNLTGMTMREAERRLEELYAKYYINPFIMLRITNRHVYVFFEDSGHGVMVNLANENTTLIEALAAAGGLTPNSKAWRIKLVRGNLRDPKVFIVDMSTIKGMKQSNLAVQSNDIVYIESTANIKEKILLQITPVIGILTSILLIISLLSK